MNTTTLSTPVIQDNLSTLFSQYRSFVLRVCFRYVKNVNEAEDLTQEIFLKVGNGWQGFTNQCQPTTWLYRVATNHCLDNFRKKKRQSQLLDTFIQEVSQDPDGEEEGETSIMRQILDVLRQEMAETDSQIVYLRFELGLTHQAISEICGLSRVAITKRLCKIHSRAIELHVSLQEDKLLKKAA